MVFDVQPPIPQRLAQVRDLFRLLAVLEALRGIGRLPHAAIDLALEPQLWIVDDECAPDEDVEQGGDVFAVDALDLRGDSFLQAHGELRDLGISRGRSVVFRNMEEHEVVVVGKGDHQLRRSQWALAQKVPHRFAGCLQHAVEFFPAVHFFHLRIAVEVEVKDDDFASILNAFTDAVDRGSDGWQAR